MMGQIGKRLKLLRMALEMNAEDVGHTIGYSANMVWQVERGNSKANIEFIANICKVYGVSIDTLVYGTDKDFNVVLNSIYSKTA